jgi:hypothetical protein
MAKASGIQSTIMLRYKGQNLLPVCKRLHFEGWLVNLAYIFGEFGVWFG